MGRKPLSDVPKSTTPLRILLTDTERKTLDSAARKAGKPTSAWAREILLTSATPPKKG